MGWHIETGAPVGRWIAAELHSTFCPEAATAIGLVRNGVIIAGAMFENWNRKSIMVHMAISGGRVTRQFIGTIFDYAYRQLDCEKVICPVDSTNVKSIAFLEKLGFGEEARIREAARTGDILIYTLARDRCGRFLGDTKYGQAVRTRRA